MKEILSIIYLIGLIKYRIKNFLKIFAHNVKDIRSFVTERSKILEGGELSPEPCIPYYESRRPKRGERSEVSSKNIF